MGVYRNKWSVTKHHPRRTIFKYSSNTQNRELSHLKAPTSMRTISVISLICIFVANESFGFSPSPSFFRSINKISSTRYQEGASNTLEGRVIEGKLRPLNNFILVKVADALEKTEGGILLTGKAKITKTEGVVVDVGPGKTHSESGVFFPMPVSVGNGVVYGKYDGTEVQYNGEKHTLIRDDDVLVKFEGDVLALDNAEVINDNVLVYVDPTEQEATPGGLLIAATVGKDSLPSTGKVVKVGTGKMATNGELMEMDIEVGDMVKFRDYAGNELKIGDDEYTVVRMEDILAKF